MPGPGTESAAQADLPGAFQYCRLGVRAAQDPHNFDTCVQNRDKADQPGGWVRDHFAWCQVGVAWAEVYPVGGGVERVEVEVWLVGYGKHGAVPGSTTDRYIEFQMRAHKWTFRGDSPGPHLWETHPDARLKMEMRCVPTDDSGFKSCREGDRNGRDDTVQNWLKSGWAEAQFYSPADEPAKANGQQIQRATVYGWFQFSMPGMETKPDHSTSDSTGVRFDSAWYITGTTGAKKLGSIFDRVDPFLAYSLAANSGYKEVADHINKALTRPGDTMPPFTDKQIPGGKASFPIRRLAPSVSKEHRTRYNANRYDKGLVCDKWFPNWKNTPAPDGSAKECDEFPFASTWEGAARSREKYDGPVYANMFSVQPLSGKQNGLAGSILGKWYNDDRILDKDKFHVKVR